ncbi:MAG: hypothetical protein KC733_11890 [Candidatus Omnitrophica bacterium]|nr:hypothetical protein [Candidatus Omnitrophota bacterium]
MKNTSDNQRRWQQHRQIWRNPLEVVNHRVFAVDVDPKLLSFETHGPWWRILHQLNIRLLISREYEHLLISLGAGSS